MVEGSVVAVRVREVTGVVGGVDTHADTHTAAALDQVGGLLGTATFPATGAGYQELVEWLRGWGSVLRVGVEGTGSYGSGLSRLLVGSGIETIEVVRPNRAGRRARGKSDPLDAENAARAVLAGTATAVPKTRTGIVESIRLVHATRAGAVTARRAAVNQFAAVLVTAPDPVRAMFRPLSVQQQVTKAAADSGGDDLADPTPAARMVLRRLATRIQALAVEIADADRDLRALVEQAAPELLAQFGVGPETAAQLLITAGDNPDRLHSPAAFAAICGTSPVPASSGKTQRHRLSRGGDRQANRALHMITLNRMKSDSETRAYVARVMERGHSKRDAIRSLKRYLARRFLPIILRALALTETATA